MTAMSTEVFGKLPYGRSLTYADLGALREDCRKYELFDGILVVTPSPLSHDQLRSLPDDGHRYELIDGVLVVSPAPKRRHQIAVGEMFVILRAAGPDWARALLAPFDVVLPDTTVLQPDVFVARLSDLTDDGLVGPPLLAVEVLSPSTRAFDLAVKKDRLARAGCPHYWTVDPDRPSITAWTLVDGEYVRSAEAAGDHTFAVTAPFAVELIPADLIR